MSLKLNKVLNKINKVRSPSISSSVRVSFEYAGRVADLDGGGNLTDEEGSGACWAAHRSDFESDLVEERSGSTAKCAERFEADGAKVYSVPERLIFLILPGFGQRCSSAGFAGGRRNVSGRARMWNWIYLNVKNFLKINKIFSNFLKFFKCYLNFYSKLF